MPTVIDLAQEYRRRLDTANTGAILRLSRAYERAQSRLQAQLEALLLAVENQPGPIKAGQLARMARYKALIEQIGQELNALSTFTINESVSMAGRWARNGELHARELMSAQLTEGVEIAAEFNRLSRDAIETLVGFTQPGGAFERRIQQLAPAISEAVIEEITQGVVGGLNPREIARGLNKVLGFGLTEALRQVRTVQVYAYREANRASMAANSDALEGWYWWSQRIPGRTCMSCIAQHGKLYPIDQPMNDHYNGLCVPLPAVKGYPSPITESGEDWFKSQTPTMQRQFMGPGKFKAWREGRIKFANFSTSRVDPVYGPMRVEAPLKDIAEPETEKGPAPKPTPPPAGGPAPTPPKAGIPPQIPEGYVGEGWGDPTWSGVGKNRIIMGGAPKGAGAPPQEKRKPPPKFKSKKQAMEWIQQQGYVAMVDRNYLLTGQLGNLQQLAQGLYEAVPEGYQYQFILAPDTRANRPPYASYTFGDSALNLTPKYWRMSVAEYNKEKDYSQVIGWSASRNFKETVIHETAHLIHSQISLADPNSSVLGHGKQQFWLYDALAEKFKFSRDDYRFDHRGWPRLPASLDPVVKRTGSRYAGSNVYEFFAECFTLYKTGRVDRVPAEMLELFEEYGL